MDIKEGKGRRADLIIWLTLSGTKVSRLLHGCEAMLGNQDKLMGSQKFVWEFNFNQFFLIEYIFIIFSLQTLTNELKETIH